MRIRFIEPRPPGHHVYDRVLLPRLGLPLMGTMLAGRGHDVRCYCESLAPIDVTDCLRADLIGISGTTSTQLYAYGMAAEFEAAGVPVVLGGPHVTFMADEALAHARFVVRGEGERTIGELVDALETERPLTGIAGLSWRAPDGTYRHNPPRPRCSQQDFEALPAPDLTLIAGHERMGVKPLMTQWGCPFDCDFCSVTAMFSRTIRHRRTDQILAELAGLAAERVFFHDDIFVVNKNRTKELLRGMIASDVTPEWLAQVRAAETVFASKAAREPDLELLRLMRGSGCWMVMVGFESVCEESLRQMNKRQQVQDIIESVDLFHAHGIKVHGLFMAGIDTDAPEQAEATVDFAKRHGIDTIQIMIETPLPGTRLFRRKEAEGQIFTKDWSLYDGHHAVMRPATMHPYDVQTRTVRAMRHFYSLPNIVLPAIRDFARHAPELTRLALRNHLPARLPTLASLALRHRWHELAEDLKARLPRSDWDDIEDMFAITALRAYGRRQTREWTRQEHTKAHLELLANLP
ncbi:MAG TPA: radical SAM protein [Streptosporangiaceae bacterium]|nr:radical SAM protein [Streptosporangiaceae bacterium]